MTIATQLAERIGTIDFGALPPDAVHWAKIGFLDTVGVTLAGHAEPCARLVARVTAAPGPALLLGSGRRVAALDAALINGAASHALDFDDCSDTLGGHPSAQLLSALLALADTTEVSGRDVLAAYVAGFETETRIARAVNFHHYEKGWHPTATLGVYTAAADAFEHKQGWFMVYNGAGHFEPARILADWAAPLDIIDPGIAIKQYPCCGSTHPAIDLAIDLAIEHELTPAMIDHVDCWTHPRRLNHTNRPDPQSNLDAKFSVQYCVARGLMQRRVVLADFEADAHQDPAARALTARIHAAPHPAMDTASTEHFGAELRVHLHDGRVLAATTDRPLGRGPTKPLPLPRLEAKFMDCAQRALDPGTARRTLELIWRLDELDDAAELGRVMAAAPAFTH